jgi:hypothetical protein|tara:strand:+ start:89 stop:199 length:111 start_codon:yes stop_codon:yes gene_type:complete
MIVEVKVVIDTEKPKDEALITRLMELVEELKELTND